jgi:hydroxymethylbilane synthase
VKRARIGTRGSALALWQARAVSALLASSGIESELVIITTTGDRVQAAPLGEAGGKRLFVKEIEDALLAGDIDVAVHSAKDMPAELPDGLVVAAALTREDPRDAVVLPARRTAVAAAHVAALQQLVGHSPVLGTSSVRRSAQLRALFPGASFPPIRGNVDTRLRKLDEGGYDAVVLAAAGLRRLGLGARITTSLPVEQCVPAPGQGIIAVEARADDPGALRAMRVLNDGEAEASLLAERAVVARLGGGCQLPLGALALHEDGSLQLHAVVASPDGTRVLKRRRTGPPGDAHALGISVAEELLGDGASEILARAREQNQGLNAPASGFGARKHT